MCTWCRGMAGHRTMDCNRPRACNLCGVRGHEYKLCPQAYRTVTNPTRYEQEKREAEK